MLIENAYIEDTILWRIVRSLFITSSDTKSLKNIENKALNVKRLCTFFPLTKTKLTKFVNSLEKYNKIFFYDHGEKIAVKSFCDEFELKDTGIKSFVIGNCGNCGCTPDGIVHVSKNSKLIKLTNNIIKMDDYIGLEIKTTKENRLDGDYTPTTDMINQCKHQYHVLSSYGINHIIIIRLIVNEKFLEAKLMWELYLFQ